MRCTRPVLGKKTKIVPLIFQENKYYSWTLEVKNYLREIVTKYGSNVAWNEVAKEVNTKFGTNRTGGFGVIHSRTC